MPPSSADPQHERRRLLERDAEWAALASSGRDVDLIISYWTDDARVYPPGMPPVIGRAALREYVTAALAIPGFRISWTTTEALLSPDGRQACLLSTNRVTLPDAAGTPVTTEGRAVTVWRREPDGEWRCAIDIWNS
jgi:ketosteroid isomerase-like protein